LEKNAHIKRNAISGIRKSFKLILNFRNNRNELNEKKQTSRSALPAIQATEFNCKGEIANRITAGPAATLGYPIVISR
jgi:hypothetical protein